LIYVVYGPGSEDLAGWKGILADNGGID